MAPQPASAGPHPESLIHRLYRHVLELFLLLFLIVAGLEFLLEKAEPVVYRWNAIVKAYNRESLPASPKGADPPPSANPCFVSGVGKP